MTSSRLPVSVVVPAFNRAGTIARALESALAQQSPFAPAEIIVVDDHSEDESGEIAKSLGARVIRHEHNRGAAAARNTAIAAARQPWLAMLDSDDEWLCDHLATLWPLRARHVLVAGASISCFDNTPEMAPQYAGTVSRRPRTLRSPAALIPQNPIPASAVLVRRDAIVAAGGYSTELRYAEDWDLWLRVLERGTGVITPRVVCIYHRHAGQKSQDAGGPSETHHRIVTSYIGRAWWSSKLEQRWTGLRLWDALEDAASQRAWWQSAKLTARLMVSPQRLVAVALRQARFRLSVRRGERVRCSDQRTARALDQALTVRRRESLS
jgi:GT2 family glycosyltransferase